MFTESHRIAIGVAALAVAMPSADLPSPSIAIRPDHSNTAAADRASRSCPGAATLMPDAGEMQVRLVRFYRAEDTMTEVWAFVPVPPAETSLDPGYEIAIGLKDSTGLTLYSESWRGAPRPDSRRARSFEMLHFLAAPGAYHLDIDIEDGGTGRQHHDAFDFRAYADDPGASDLLLAPLIRLDPTLDGPIALGEFRHGASVVTPAAEVCVSPDRAQVFYLLEVYLEGMQAQAGAVEASVTDSAGRVLAHTPPVAVAVGTGGAVLRGQVRAKGLAPGAYALRVQAKVGARTLERAAPFLVTP